MAVFNQSNVFNETTSEDSTEFTVKADAAMFNLLTANIYSYPQRAVIREWSTNACDACIDAGKPVRFDVHVPENSDATFSVRDYGTGLSPDKVKSLFTVLGESSKREDEKQNGCLGIGRMAAFAIADMFAVTSYFEGKKSVYTVSKRDGIPVLDLLMEVDTDQESGLQLSVEVPSMHYFNDQISEVYSHFEYKPNFLNEDKERLEKDSNAVTQLTPSVYSFDFGLGLRVRMNQVAYEVSSKLIPSRLGFSTNSLVLDVPSGAVTFAPNREQLLDTPQNREVISNYLQKFQEEYYSFLKKRFETNDYLFKEGHDLSTKLKNFLHSSSKQDINFLLTEKYKDALECFSLPAGISFSSIHYEKVTFTDDLKDDFYFGNVNFKEYRNVSYKKASITHILHNINYIEDVESYSAKTYQNYVDQAVVWKCSARVPEKRKAFIQKAISICKSLGLDYKLSSEIIPKNAQEKVKVVKKDFTEVRCVTSSTYNYTSTLKKTVSVHSRNFLYVFEDVFSLSQLTVLSHYLTKNYKDYVLVSLAKSNVAKVKKLDNWTAFEDVKDFPTLRMRNIGDSETIRWNCVFSLFPKLENKYDSLLEEINAYSTISARFGGYVENASENLLGQLNLPYEVENGVPDEVLELKSIFPVTFRYLSSDLYISTDTLNDIFRLETQLCNTQDRETLLQYV